MFAEGVFEKIRLTVAFSALAMIAAMSFVVPWYAALATIVISLVWLFLLVSKSACISTFFWILLSDVLVLTHFGVGKSYVSEAYFGALAFAVSAALLLTMLLERIPAISGRPEKQPFSDFSKLLAIAAFCLSIFYVFYLHYFISFAFVYEKSPALIDFAAVAADDAVRIIPPMFSAEYDMSPYYSMALSCAAVLLVLTGLKKTLKRALLKSARPPLAFSFFVVLAALIGVFRLASYASEYLQFEAPAARTGCLSASSDHEFATPPASLVKKARQLEDNTRLLRLLELRARGARLADRPLEAVADYSAMAAIAPDDGRHIVALAAALSQAGFRNRGLRLGLRLIDGGEDLKDFEACLLDDYEMHVDLWMRYGSEREQMLALRPLAPPTGLKYIPDSDKRRHSLVVRYGSLCAYSGELDEARRVAQAVLETKPYDGGALNIMGEIAYREEDFLAALEYFDQAYELERNNYLHLFNLLSVLAIDGDNEIIPVLQGHLLQEFGSEFWQGPQGGDFSRNGMAEMEFVALPGWSQFGIIARGEIVAGSYPVFSVFVNDEHIDDYFVSSDKDLPYTGEFYARRGINRIRVVFNGKKNAGDIQKDPQRVLLHLEDAMVRPIFWHYEIRWP